MAASDFQILYLQKRLIEKQFECFKCVVRSHGQILSCKGSLQPLEYIEPYQIEILQRPGKSPKVFIKSPRIDYNPNIHMYKEGNLCLFYPLDFNWNAYTSVVFFTIPWINEWIIYYEIYKISGIWEGSAAPHPIIE